MWIVPKNLSTSHSVQVMGESTSDLKKLSEMSEQSLMWRSKPSQSATWLQRWKKGLLSQHLSGRILKPSTGKSFVEKWISCQEASLVSPLVQQEKEKQTQTQDTSSHISSEELKYLNLPLFSLRMSKESSQQNSNQMIGQIQKEHRFCSMFLENWRGWVTKQRQVYSQREKSVLHIKGNESSYLLLKEVPKEKAWNGSMDSLTETETQVALYTPPQEEETNTHGSLQESLWGTPNTLDHLDQRSDEALRRLARAGGRKRRSHPGNLREQVNPHAIEIYQDLLKETQEKEASIPLYGMPTPTTQEIHHKEMPLTMTGRRKAKGVGESHSLNLPDRVSMGKDVAMKLNPRWVETLMGLPIGWVQPSCTSPLIIERMSSECLEMELFQILQEEPSLIYGENWSTPPASQRGENLRHYISRMKSRLEQGKETFAPTLQVQVEAEERGVDIEESIWATPNTMDSLPLRSDEALRRQANTTRKGRSAPSNLREQVNENSCEIYKEERLKLDEKGQVSLF